MILIFIIITIIFLFLNLVPRFYTRRHEYRIRVDNSVNDEMIEYTAKAELPKHDPCEVIHIGTVCSGYNSNIYFHTLLKSLYFYRVNPIHFHILTNKNSKHILKTLFDSWNVPQVNVTFYNMNDYILDVRWIPNSHYSGIHGLLKLIFPKVIPLEVTDRLLVLDTDLIFASDIFELWEHFKKFRDKQAIGIVENQSNFYLAPNTWPAINRGFNTGVLLYHLKVLNDIDWHTVWSNITKRSILSYGSASLADQDVINVIFTEMPELLYEVPCGWNTQLSDNSLSFNCYKESKIKIIHWNSPKKYKVINRDGDYFRSIALGFQEYNGNLFRRKLHICDIPVETASNQSEPLCSDLHNQQNSHWTTLLYFREYDYTPVDYDVTFVAQLSYDRSSRIEELVKNWSGPISFTLYLTDTELRKTLFFIEHSDVLKSRTNVAYHCVFKDGDYYPINMLRNVGLKNVETRFVFLADIDFLPSKNLYESLRVYTTTYGSLRRKAFIVPAFEIQNSGTSIPKDKAELLTKLGDNSITPFLSKIWEPGHTATDYDTWKTAVKPYLVKWQPDYEPYIVVRKDVAEYDERFVGFGWNKVSHIMELEAQNYRFIVLPDVFIVHVPHNPSEDIAQFRTSVPYRMCLQLLKEEFIQELNKRYNRNFQISNASFVMKEMVRRRKRGFASPVRLTTVETNTDYPANLE